MTPEYEQLLRAARKHALWQPGAATHEVSLGRPAIERLIRHRDPFLFVDSITAVDLEQRAARGRRRIDPNDPIFAGHFPGAPIYPGVLQLETMGQLGLCLLHFIATGTFEVTASTQPRDVRALTVHQAQFHAEVWPDDTLDILATVIDINDYTGICAGQLMRGNSITSLAIMEVYFVDES